ncbi:MAG: NAD(P)-dependent oxidoreductase [Candidatus Hydrogenedentes bacterium]|nr:NAD(P)-dependent oxidoreductase [Candidatus Hydrogenedentota bacterium]
MKVLVTGSSGHVGGAIARYLHDRGHTVVGMSRRRAALPEAIQQISTDISVPEFLVRAFVEPEPFDAIVHAAAVLSKAPFNPVTSVVNGVGTHQVLRLAHELQVRSFVFISGVAVIGQPAESPITEAHPVAPKTAYHASKLYGEHLTAIAREAGIPSVVLRLTAPIGPGTPRGRILTHFVERALRGEPLVLHGNGTRRQNYVDVRDAAKATATCIERGVTGLYNISGNETVSNHELAQRCIAVLSSGSEVVFSGEPDPDDAVSWEVSSQAATEAFGYAPEHSLEASIQSMK